MAKSLSGLLPVLKVKMNNKRWDIIYGPKKDKKKTMTMMKFIIFV